MSLAGSSKAHANYAQYSSNLDYDLTLSRKGHYLALNSEQSSVIGNPLFDYLVNVSHFITMHKPNTLSLFIANFTWIQQYRLWPKLKVGFL